MKKCQLCKCESEETKKPKFSDNFMSSNLLSEGDGFCNPCDELFTNQKNRKSSWIMQEKDMYYFKRDEIIKILKSEKKTPFILYFTQTYKTQGFLNLISRPNYNNEKFIVGFDRDVITVNRDRIKTYEKIIIDAREKKFLKTELLTTPLIKKWEHEKLCKKIMKCQKDQLWRLMVFAI